MPYRRLPKTDQARLKALQMAVQRSNEVAFDEQAISFHTLTEVQRFLLRFESSVCLHAEKRNSKVSANKQYRHDIQTARMYISHFIQVLNLAVIRGEIKKEQKELYHLDPNSHVVPDLTTEDDVLEWGQNIIQGEQERTQMGGFPIYNPAINKVKVYYDIFKEHYVSIKQHRKITEQSKDGMEDLRMEADRILLDIWNQVETKYEKLLPYEKMVQCQLYGLIYYYRSGEKRLTKETDKKIREAANNQMTIQWLP